jgi:hypothetical protein
MKLHRIRIAPSQFNAIPERERALLVLCAHILNEVNALNRLLACSAKIEPGPVWHVHAGNAQAMLLCRLLVGKLSESWAAVQESFFRSRLSGTYEPLLDPAAATALDWLKAYFGKKNIITTVRNSFAFHYSVEHASRAIPADTIEDECVLYLQQWVGNSLYQLAELVMGSALLDSVDRSDLSTAMERLLGEMSVVVGKMNDFFQGVMVLVLDRHIGQASVNARSDEIEVPEVPELGSVRIPYFVDVPIPKPSEAA